MPVEMFNDPHAISIMVVGWTVIATIFGLGIFLVWKRKTKVLSIKKVVIMSLFLGLFLLQSYLSSIFTGMSQIPFSLNVMTVIVVGVLFGPAEGIIYGLLADTIGVFIKGYQWDPLNALIYPIYGALSGIGREIYFKWKDGTPKSLSVVLSQIPIMFIFLASLSLTGNSSAMDRAGVQPWVVYTFGTLALVIMESIIIWFAKTREKDKMFMIMIIAFIAIIGRVIGGWYIRSYGQTFWISTPLHIIMMGRIITTSYMTPANIVISYWAVNASLYAMRVTDWRA